jgi:hypothetical protein
MVGVGGEEDLDEDGELNNDGGIGGKTANRLPEVFSG